jgi:hypothetical protein
MRRNEIESMAFNVLDRIAHGKKNEDDHIELKREWLAPDRAAWLVGGHANQLNGEPVLWLFGIDEDDGCVGVHAPDLADWIKQFESKFSDRVSPNLLEHFIIPIDGKDVVALRFETDGAPYVVTNPDGGKFGTSVPIRKGTSTNCASRSDLFRLLAPQQSVPVLDVQRCWCELAHDATAVGVPAAEKLVILAVLEIYLVPSGSGQTVLPKHLASAKLESLEPPATTPLAVSYTQFGSNLLITNTGNELVVDGPGLISIDCSGRPKPFQPSLPNTVTLSIELRPVGTDRVAKCTAELTRSPRHGPYIARWEMEAQRPQE